MIELNTICVEKNGKQILSNIDLHIEKGESLVLTGPSGAGKTSILRTMLGAMRVASGKGIIGGIELNVNNIAAIRSQIAFIGQEPIMGAESVKDSLLLPFSFIHNKNIKPSNDYIVELLNSVNLDQDILVKKSSDISGGEKQRIAIVRAILQNKSIIFADELTSSLDHASRKRVIDLLLRGEYTVVSISHDDVWIEHCSRIISVLNGSIEDKI